VLAQLLDLRLREPQFFEASVAVVSKKACHLTRGLRLPRGDHSIEGAFQPATSLPGCAGVVTGDSRVDAHHDLLSFFLGSPPGRGVNAATSEKREANLGSASCPCQTVFGKAELSPMHAVEVVALRRKDAPPSASLRRAGPLPAVAANPKR